MFDSRLFLFFYPGIGRVKDAGGFAHCPICDFVRNIRCLVDILGVFVLILCKSICCVFIGGG